MNDRKRFNELLTILKQRVIGRLTDRTEEYISKIKKGHEPLTNKFKKQLLRIGNEKTIIEESDNYLIEIKRK